MNDFILEFKIFNKRIKQNDRTLPEVLAFKFLDAVKIPQHDLQLILADADYHQKKYLFNKIELLLRVSMVKNFQSH